MIDAAPPTAYRTLTFTRTFIETFIDLDFTAMERRRFMRAIGLLDENERHPSLRDHQLRGDLKGIGSASASDKLRISFRRRSGGTKVLLTCSQHYRR